MTARFFLFLIYILCYIHSIVHLAGYTILIAFTTNITQDFLLIIQFIIMLTFTCIVLSLLFSRSSLTIRITPLPSSDVVDASSGLILHYLNNTYSPSNRIISFTVSIPMTIDTCYLIPLNIIQKISRCHRSPSNFSLESLSRGKQFLTDIISIGIGIGRSCSLYYQYHTTC